jgi:hypothetical protein
MERNEIDYLFAIGLLIVAVIAVAELQGASFYLGQYQVSQADIWGHLFFVFEGTMVPMFVLVTIWLTAMIFPHVKIPLARRRYFKEFCWALLGNVLALEIVICGFLRLGIYLHWSIGYEVVYSGGGWRIFELLPSFFLTLLATWQYRRIDSTKNQSTIKFGLTTVLEHGLIYSISYFLLLMILVSSVPLLI